MLFQGKVYVSLEVSEKPAPDCSILREKTSRLIQLRICTDSFSAVNDDKKLCCLFCEIPTLTGLYLGVLLWLLANFASITQILHRIKFYLCQAGEPDKPITGFEIYSVKGGIWLQMTLASVLLFLFYQ